MSELDPTTQTTKFVNIDDEEFDIYIGGKLSHHLKTGEEKVMPLFVAKVGAKHLCDRILQKQGIADTNRPSPEKDTLLAKILPEAAEQEAVKPMTEEEYKAAMEKRLAEQQKQIESLGGKVDNKDMEIKMLKMQLGKLQKAVKGGKK